MTDVVEVRGLRALGVCGVLPEERQRPQPLEVDLEVRADLHRAGESDDLADTVDYATLSEAVVQTITGGHFALLEKLAESIASRVLSEPGVESVVVAVRKLRPPLALDVATTGVRIERR
ncbi:MAG: Dihydroneopterin aldolase [Acidimicrobiales bacterium]|nr:Dihydroneopterin aldolase [Acidimicrobiales bacterium]